MLTIFQILTCIFVAIRSSSTPAHRELIDMVMAVKESNKISQLEHVSKTKVRGVLALLKHGELLITQGAEGEPVRLYLAHGINTFKDLRERHDVFLGRYMLEHHLFIPAILKSELVWQFEEDTKAKRLESLNKLVAQLHFFYKSYVLYQQQSNAEAEDAGLQLLRTASSEDDLAVGARPRPAANQQQQQSDAADPVLRGQEHGGGGNNAKEEWGFVRPQSLPVQKSLSMTPEDFAAEGAEQRPKSTAGYTTFQHAKLSSGGSSQQLSEAPQQQQQQQVEAVSRHSVGNDPKSEYRQKLAEGSQLWQQSAPGRPQAVRSEVGPVGGYSIWGGKGQFGSSDTSDTFGAALEPESAFNRTASPDLFGDLNGLRGDDYRAAPLRPSSFPSKSPQSGLGFTGLGHSLGAVQGGGAFRDEMDSYFPQQPASGGAPSWSSSFGKEATSRVSLAPGILRAASSDFQQTSGAAPGSFAGEQRCYLYLRLADCVDRVRPTGRLSSAVACAVSGTVARAGQPQQ